jgi:hypothetical protein
MQGECRRREFQTPLRAIAARNAMRRASRHSGAQSRSISHDRNGLNVTLEMFNVFVSVIGSDASRETKFPTTGS